MSDKKCCAPGYCSRAVNNNIIECRKDSQKSEDETQKSVHIWSLPHPEITERMSINIGVVRRKSVVQTRITTTKACFHSWCTTCHITHCHPFLYSNGQLLRERGLIRRLTARNYYLVMLGVVWAFIRIFDLFVVGLHAHVVLGLGVLLGGGGVGGGIICGRGCGCVCGCGRISCCRGSCGCCGRGRCISCCGCGCCCGVVCWIGWVLVLIWNFLHLVFLFWWVWQSMNDWHFRFWWLIPRQIIIYLCNFTFFKHSIRN